MRLVGVAAVAMWSVAGLSAQDPAAHFQFLSIHHNTAGSRASSSSSPAPDRYVLTNTTLKSLILRAYAQTASPAAIVSSPPWLDELYDVVIAGPFKALNRAQQQPLWRELLADRLKLAAHTELRSEPGFDLVLARPDLGLGPAFKPPNCSSDHTPLVDPATNAQRFPSPEEAMTRCGWARLGGTLYSGGISMPMLASFLAGEQGRRGVDKTGVDGVYSVTFPIFSQRDDYLSRMEKELGLNLVPSMTDAEVIVIDHIERPSEN
jgi:uncharacterized protein (TIGR03435 family)